tara:strand:- start:4552 stop:4773 length:222 start_codon:yes stop_codon:yes gene_type:complete
MKKLIYTKNTKVHLIPATEDNKYGMKICFDHDCIFVEFSLMQLFNLIRKLMDLLADRVWHEQSLKEHDRQNTE